MFLANFARSIRVLICGRDLNASMSRYLIERIGSLPNVSICTRCPLDGLDGDAAGFTHVRIRREDADDQDDEVVTTRHLFLFIGADPETDWLTESGVELDARGFVRTGAGRNVDDVPARFPLETNVPVLFAVGDVRSDSAKRVAAQIHALLATSSEVRTTRHTKTA